MKPKKYKKDVLIEVEWDDIVADSAWLKEEDAAKHPPTPCRNTGYFLNSDKKVLRISGSIQNGKKDLERDITVIPWGVIKKITKLQRSKK